MKVTVLEPSGFCSGVDRAISLAIKTKNDNKDKNIVVLGMLVHNASALENLKNHNISTISKNGSSLEELVTLIDKPSIVILTAHGHDKHIEELLKLNGHEIVDATCPFVNNSFSEILKEVKKGNAVFYIGVKNHPEANAALSIDKNIELIDVFDPIIPKITSKNPIIISQTTLSENEVNPILESIFALYKDAKYIRGICNASTLRQEALKNISEDVDGIYVVGGKNSNNSKTLFNLAKDFYPNKFVKLIETIDDINEKDLVGLHHIALSSGASTPKEIINQIKQKLLN